MADVHTSGLTSGLTWRDLDELYPDLEHRELHDGVLVVTPAPGCGTSAPRAFCSGP